MKKLLLIILVFPLLLAGCGLREPLYDFATTSPEDIPRIITFDPADNLYDVPRNALIGILFSEPMDQESLESSFSYSYNDRTYGPSNGAFLWDSSGRLAVFRSYSFFPSMTEVSVNVGFYVKSKKGLNLDEGASWKFETSSVLDFGPNYNITSTWASNETVVAGIHTLDAQVVLEFDKEMLRSSVEGSFQLISSDFQDIRTVNDGFFLWSEPSLGIKRAIFTANEPLLGGKTYLVYLNANGMQAVDVAGNSLMGIMPAPLHTFQTIDAIYVSTTGDDNNEGYLGTIPVQTIGRALERAIEYTLPYIRIEEGNYNEDIVLNNPIYNGFSFQGGWDTGFIAYDPDPTVNQSSIYTVTGNYDITLSGVDGITLDTLFLIGPTTGPPDINGAVRIEGGSSNIWIYNCYLIGSDVAEQGHGVRITGNSRNIDIYNSRIIGANVPSTNRSFGISIDNAHDIYIHDNIDIQGGGALLNNAAIHIAGNSSNVMIERNQIIGGSTGVLEGIYVGGASQNILIQDNNLISAGSTLDANTYGLLIESGAVVNIHKNTIIGGDDPLGAAPNTHVGIRFNSAGDCNLFNNYIVGGAQATDLLNNSYGVYVYNCDVNIINNTIFGLGNVGGSTIGIYGDNTDSNIINNIIGGGQGANRYGIALSDYDTSVNDVLIFSNTFSRDRCIDGYLFDGTTPLFPIPAMEGGYNSGTRMPANNLEYLPGEITYVDELNGDFTINGGTNLALIQNNGYAGLNSVLSPTEMNDIEFDRLWWPRPIATPATIDRGGNESLF